MDDEHSLRQRRAQAEAWLAGQPPAAPACDKDDLWHELRVLQIELDMQTEAWRAAQNALGQARERYAELYELAPVAYLTLTRGGLIVEANIAAATLLGVARKQLRDECFDRFVAPVDDNLWRQRLAAVVAQEGPQRFELALTNPDGALHACRALAECRRLASDAGATVLLTLTDISGRHATEDLLRKLSLAVEQSPESIVITNLAGEIEYVNEAFVRIAGYAREALIGRNMSLLQSGRTPRATYAAMWDALRDGRDWQGEFINRREDGSEYVERASISPLRQPDGRVTHYVAVKQCLDERSRRDDSVVPRPDENGAAAPTGDPS